eukprot:g2804.t1
MAGPVEDSGHVRLGDILVKFNGVDVSGLSLEETRALIGRQATPQPGQTSLKFDLHFRRPPTTQRATSTTVGVKKANDFLVSSKRLSTKIQLPLSDSDCHLHLFVARSEKQTRKHYLSAVVAAKLASFGSRPKGRLAETNVFVPSSITGCTAYEAIEGHFLAVVKRGQCSFLEKALRAQAAGAHALVIFNTDTDLFTMRSEDEAAAKSIRIPVVLIAEDDGSRIRNMIHLQKLYLSCILQMGDDKMLHDPRSKKSIEKIEMFARDDITIARNNDKMLMHPKEIGTSDDEFGDWLRLYRRGKRLSQFDLTPAVFSGPFDVKRRFRLRFAKGHACKAHDKENSRQTFGGFAVIVPRGKCSYGLKADNLERAGASAVIVYNHHNSDLIQMSREGRTRSGIPVVMISADDADTLKRSTPRSRLTISFFTNSQQATNSPDDDSENRRRSDSQSNLDNKKGSTDFSIVFETAACFTVSLYEHEVKLFAHAEVRCISKIACQFHERDFVVLENSGGPNVVSLAIVSTQSTMQIPVPHVEITINERQTKVLQQFSTKSSPVKVSILESPLAKIDFGRWDALWKLVDLKAWPQTHKARERLFRRIKEQNTDNKASLETLEMLYEIIQIARNKVEL